MIRVVLTVLGAIIGFMVGGWLSILLAARYASAADDVPPFDGILMGAIFGVLLGALLVQLIFKLRDPRTARRPDET